jgi:RNA polymerase sigma-70 factor, ECF subfamily
VPARSGRAHPRAAGGPSPTVMRSAVSLAAPSVAEGSAMQEASSSVDARAPDAESVAWIEALTGPGPQRDDAIERLHALLVRACRFEVGRRWRASCDQHSGDHDDLAMQAADDALVAILRKLDTYRGESRFTTWAYKFALLEAGVKARKRSWQGREVPLEQEGWAQLPDRHALPDADTQMSELVDAIRDAIAESLTPHQRSVLIAITLNDVPIDVLADRLSTTRGALYKTLHDARKKLRARLAEDGLDVDSQRGDPT